MNMNFYFLVVLIVCQVITSYSQHYYNYENFYDGLGEKYVFKRQQTPVIKRYCKGNDIVCEERIEAKKMSSSFPSDADEVICERCINESHNIEETNVTRKANFTIFRDVGNGCFAADTVTLNAGCQICGEMIYWAYFNYT